MDESKGPTPTAVFWLVLGLPDNSMVSAMQRGGLHYLGWGEDRELAAQTFNALQLQTRATGNWKRKPNLPEWPRPKPFEPVIKKKHSLAEVSAVFSGPGAFRG